MGREVRVIVTGCREWRCEALAERVVARMVKRYGYDLVIVHGAAPGVDHAFDLAALKYRVRREPYPAEWIHHGAAAGPIRNGRMVKAGARFVLAVHRFLANSKGTKDCVRQAMAAGIPVYLIDSEDAEPRRLDALEPAGG
jgi:hypothetical protein